MFKSDFDMPRVCLFGSDTFDFVRLIFKQSNLCSVTIHIFKIDFQSLYSITKVF